MRPCESRAMLSVVFLMSCEPSGRVCEDCYSTPAVSGEFGIGVTNIPSIRMFTPRYGGGVCVTASCACNVEAHETKAASARIANRRVEWTGLFRNMEASTRNVTKMVIPWGIRCQHEQMTRTTGTTANVRTWAARRRVRLVLNSCSKGKVLTKIPRRRRLQRNAAAEDSC